ncbi:uncharacterized protein LOC135138536 [Zophobas morio]|uniref:uncharacterized protein LOC135138536 n=1 Tax=Zophobas morio TaxID=2755281 RepID=UPI0030833DF9
MTFTLCAKKFVYDYNIDGTAVQRSTTVKDPVVIYDCQFNFKDHVDCIVSKARKLMGFIIRNCKEFNITSLTALFNALVRSRLEYCSLAWFPYYQNQILSLEKIQQKFLKYLYFKEEKRWPGRNQA